MQDRHKADPQRVIDIAAKYGFPPARRLLNRYPYDRDVAEIYATIMNLMMNASFPREELPSSEEIDEAQREAEGL